LQDKVVIGEAISKERNAGAVAKGNKTLHDALNQALSKVMADGTYAKLSAQWFGQDIRCK
jgi:amino acid ABC transporter substrate-binding protein, PAAT family (TC 3.A.1.3.-)